jgi:hypothetical protein
MTIPTLTTLPVAPARTDPPATFVTRADAFLAAIVTFQGEMNTSIGAMNTDIAGVNADAVAAAAAAAAAVPAAASATASAATAAADAVIAADAASGIQALYLGSKAANPTTDNQGNALVVGAMYFNTVVNLMKVYLGNATWADSGSAVNGTLNRQNYVATAGQTVFAINYDVGFVDVYLNGVKLVVTTDFTALTGSAITLVTGATVGDAVELIAYGAFSVADQLQISNNLSDVASAPASIINLGINATAAELNYVSGVTSSIQTQIASIQTEIDNISPTPTIEAVASGTIANGDTVCLNSDGTVSVVTGSSATEGVGTLTIFNSSSSEYMDSVYDEANNKIVVGYKNTAGPEYYVAQVGTVSGSSISWGTAVEVHTETSLAMSLTYDKAAGKILFVYAGSSIVAGRVGTVSGTTISFGTQTTLFSGAVRAGDITSGYDENTQKHAVFFVQTSNNYSLSVVATVSGTSVSAGSTTTLLSSPSYNAFKPKMATYDETAQKLVIFYMDYSDSEKGKANVCTISGTTISFGTQAEWSNGTVDAIQAAYSPSLNKHMIVWREAANSSLGTSRIATVSGTTISFGDLYVFRNVDSRNNAIAWDNTGGKFIIATRSNTYAGGDILTATVTDTTPTFSAVTQFSTTNALYNILTYDPDEGKVIGVYRDDNDGYGKSYVWTTGFFSSNVTSTNFVGFSDAAYTNGQTATIQIIAAQDDAQTGLTAGIGYYVQANGDLSATPDTISVYAGVATSATNIIVKG